MTLATQQRLQTRNGLLPEARHVVLPSGIRSSAFPAVEATCSQIGLSFDDWQRDLNRAILGKDASGLYAADTVVMSIPRQVGKTWDVGALVFADCIINPGTLTVWTAHQFKVARETFNELKALAQSPALAPHIDVEQITTAAGNESIPFRNGSRIVFAARERGAIRGFSKVRRLILDEAQILTERALADLAPTMNQATNPQIILMGTPPRPVDPGEVFTRIRKEALDGESDGVLYVEFSAPPDASPSDWGALREANPSYPHRTTKKAIERLRKLLSPDDFMREVYGIWDQRTGAVTFGPGAWEECHGTMPPGLAMGAIGVAVSHDLTRSALVAAAVDEDGFVHVKPIQHAPGTGWVVERSRELQERHGVEVVIDGRGPAAVLIPNLEREVSRTRVVNTGEVLDSCAHIFDLVQERRLRHESYPELDAAVTSAVKRSVGDRWAWGRKASADDISTLEAATLAAHAAAHPIESAVSAYEARGVMTI